MAYTKHTWVNESEPAINADHLNEMEDGIEIGVGKQDKITANGILKGNGSGTISAATAGTDYMKSMKISGSGNYISNIEQSNGVITATKANLPTASATTLGMVKVDGTTITINDGIISSSGSGGTTVVANPSGVSSSTRLDYIQISGSNYSLPYLPTNGSKVMAGSLDMNNYDIDNVGNLYLNVQGSSENVGTYLETLQSSINGLGSTYLQLAGGTMTGNLTINNNARLNLGASSSNVKYGSSLPSSGNTTGDLFFLIS